MLLAAGADPNLQNLRGNSPLLFASQEGHLDTVRVLIDGGAEIDLPDINGATPLTQVCGSLGRADVARALLEGGADTEYKDLRGQTALDKAVKYASSRRVRHLDVIRVLLEYGADPDKPNREGQSHIATAAKNGHAGAVGLLLDAGCCRDKGVLEEAHMWSQFGGNLRMEKRLEKAMRKLETETERSDPAEPAPTVTSSLQAKENDTWF